MKVRIPKHREFVIEFQEEGQKQNEGWAELQKVLRMIMKSRENPSIPKPLLKTTKKK